MIVCAVVAGTVYGQNDARNTYSKTLKGAYAGAFLHGLSRGWDAGRAGRLASSIAGLTVAQVGATVKEPNLLAQALGATA